MTDSSHPGAAAVPTKARELARHELVISDVTAGYGPVPIIHNVSMRAESARLVALIGPNGAGKSTLLKAIMGILHPRNGSILLDDTPVHDLRPDQIVRAGIGYVPQVGDVFDHLTVAENLSVGGIIAKKTRDAKREEVLELFPLLVPRLKQRARTLSGGERRILAVARALMSSPKLVIMDEPSAGLSPRAMKLVWEHLEILRDEGLALLVVEQKAKAIMAIADWVYVLVDGRNALEAAGETMLANVHDLGRIFMGQQLTLNTGPEVPEGA
ncbi:MAG TPA: ABC transporter ATP-binding protein [Acidimicrobiales bacterium]|nr:ABC transporter ATP-binding protein [Acidimicrobiales bacterium]